MIAEVLISVPAVSIAGGTDEIQRNIIAERMLRMPKDPSSDTNRPFRDVPKNPRRPPPYEARLNSELRNARRSGRVIFA